MSFVDLFNVAPAKPSLSRPRPQHRVYAYLLLVFAMTLLAAVKQGEMKLLVEVDWVDVVGEGAAWIAALAWLHFTMAWRPPGPVTRWLVMGFALLSYGFYLDVLDEAVRFNNTLWGQSLESIFTPLAIAVLTVAALWLHDEQRILGRQQQRREAHFRDHQAIDRITDLYNADYCCQTLQDGIDSSQPPALWLIDVQDFDAINQRFGFAAGDAVLNRMANTLVATVPDDSLVCRYGGDRFAVLTQQRQLALSLEIQLSQLLSSAMTLAVFDLAGEEVNCRVRAVSIEAGSGESAEQVFQRANTMLQAKK